MVELVSFNIIVILVLISFYYMRHIKWLKSFHLLFMILILSVLIAGLFVVNNSVNELNAFLERREWPVVAGRISSAEMKGLKTHEPVIKYMYQVEGVMYQGNSNLGTPLFGGSKSQRRVAQTILADFSAGDTIRVFFNPHDYAQSVLKVNPKWSVYIQYSFSLIVSSLMLTIIINRLLKSNLKKTA